MKYVNLSDYVDRPELVQHRLQPNEKIVTIVKTDHQTLPYTVVYGSGNSGMYTADGRVPSNVIQLFILKEKPKKTITGYRKDVLTSEGVVLDSANWHPSKTSFEANWKGHTPIGEWQTKTWEVEDD